MKACPYCGEQIQAEARKCRHCGEFLDDHESPEVNAPLPENLPWVTAASWLLALAGLAYLALGFAFVPLFEWAESDGGQPMPPGLRAFMWGFSLVFFGGFACLNWLVAWGLTKRAKWAWIGAIVCGALYAPSICLPLGVLILYAVLREDAKRTFLRSR